MSARHRMSMFLLRRGYRYRDTHQWGVRHRKWLRRQTFAPRAAHATFDHYRLNLDQLDERLRQLDAQLGVHADQKLCRESVAWLRCYRGIDATLTRREADALARGLNAGVTTRTIVKGSARSEARAPS